MRWIRFTTDGRTAYGSLSGDTVSEISGEPWGAHQATGKTFKLGDIRLEVPVIPRTFYAAGINYAAHIREMAEKRGVQPVFPEKADIGYRANNALIAHDGDVVIPKDATEKINYEGELVVVIGKQAKHLSKANAMSCVFGYTIGNDVSERTWQKADSGLWRAKNTDTFKPMGPWIETDVRLPNLFTRVRINGNPMVEFRTNDMIFGVERYIAEITKYMTLHAGDVIWMGTEGSNADMKAGDVVEVEIDGIGTLRNPVVAEQRLR
jgi:2-keto-4-pentenoate hydratase/2-oxohepta-3-ene-1,7-dioic acid hydratase in catechol pathway